MSFFGILGNVMNISKASSSDKNSQTDFDFDDQVTDGNNIGIRVDPGPAKIRQRSRSIPKTPDIQNPENMLMAERMFYGNPDQDDQWNLSTVNDTKEEEQAFCAVEKTRDNYCNDPCNDPCRDPCKDPCKDPCRDPCKDPCKDPCLQEYAKCIQRSMASEEDPCRPNCNPKTDSAECRDDEADEVEKHNGMHKNNDPTSRGREGKQRTNRADRPYRKCSDLCRVTNRKATHKERTKESRFAADPCAPKDPCADPCQKTDPCLDPCAKADPCFDPCASNQCDDPCCPPDPCRRNMDPCLDPCQDPCQTRVQCCPPDPCKSVDDAHAPEHGDHQKNGKEPCPPCPTCPQCPPCPPCQECPICPECPPCPPSPSRTSASAGYRPCNTSSSTNQNSSVGEVNKTAENEWKPPANQSKAEDEKSAPVCPDPLFPTCKSSEENCQSLVCPEDI